MLDVLFGRQRERWRYVDEVSATSAIESGSIFKCHCNVSKDVSFPRETIFISFTVMLEAVFLSYRSTSRS